MSYDLPWANASNSPFRLFKSWVHEGGIATPFVVNWPAALTSLSNNGANDIHHKPWIVMDIVATCCELGGIYVPLEGESFLPILQGKHVKVILNSISICIIHKRACDQRSNYGAQTTDILGTPGKLRSKNRRMETSI